MSGSVKGLADLKKKLQDAEKRAANNIAKAITRAAFKTRADVQQIMPRAFDRPTPFTLRSLYVLRATSGNDHTATLRFKDADLGLGGKPAGVYLLPNIVGTFRSLKRFEERLMQEGMLPSGHVAVPAQGAVLDGFGNVNRGQMTQIIRQIGRSTSLRSMAREKKRRVSKRTPAGQYFVLSAGGGAKPGIYVRKSASQIVPVFLFVRQRRPYAKRFPYRAYASERAVFHIPRELMALGGAMG